MALLNPNTEASFALRLKDAICSSLAVQQHWFRGELSAEVNVLFLGMRDGKYLRFFFDHELFFWSEKERPALPESDGENRYTLLDHPDWGHGTNYPVENVDFQEEEDGRSLRITFAGGRILVLLNQADSQKLKLNIVTVKSRE